MPLYNSLSTRIIANFVVPCNERTYCATVLLLLSRLMSATTPQRLFLARLSYSRADRAGLSTIVIKKKSKEKKSRAGRRSCRASESCADKLSNGRKIAAIKVENTSATAIFSQHLRITRNCRPPLSSFAAFPSSHPSSGYLFMGTPKQFIV